jgi:GT2 family glycosyltransferase
MDANPQAGFGGGRLIGPEESWQPSARSFPSLLNDFLSLSGLAARFPNSRFFGRGDRTWSDAGRPAEVDWVPGAFAIVRPDALAAAGSFDESFFLYYEEVDLCRRIKALGYRILYWPDVVIVHLGGESSRTTGQRISRAGSQLTLWRLRSRLIYYRKHHGARAYPAYLMELLWHRARWFRNSFGAGGERREKATESLTICVDAKRAWKETRGGRVSPPRPW